MQVLPETSFRCGKTEFTLKDADPDIPIYKQVKAEYAKLH